MPTTDRDRAHEVLGRDEALRLLTTTSIGRLAYTQAALPAIRPVSFSLPGRDVLIPVPGDGSLIDALRGSIVAFEADAYDEVSRTGWTVSVIGPSRLLGTEASPGSAWESWVIAVRVELVQGWRTGRPS